MQDDPELVELLDRLIATGVIAEADLVLGVADVDLLRVGLKAMLASVTTVGAEARTGPGTPAARIRPDRPAMAVTPAGPGDRERPPVRASVRPQRRTDGAIDDLLGASSDLESLLRRGPSPVPSTPDGPRVALEPENAARGLGQLVLGLVDLLRRLMERQADRRLAAGELTTDETERLATTFQALDDRMAELRSAFELTEEETTLRLPLDGYEG